jgi:hypothetical protein
LPVVAQRHSDDLAFVFIDDDAGPLQLDGADNAAAAFKPVGKLSHLLQVILRRVPEPADPVHSGTATPADREPCRFRKALVEPVE